MKYGVRILLLLVCLSAASLPVRGEEQLVGIPFGTGRTVKNGYTVCIDPGHQGSWVDMSAQEPIGPGADQTKAKASTGTQSPWSGLTEYELNLQVGLALEEELTDRGYQVVMTRRDNDTAVSNAERAALATEKGADISVRIHANGSDDAGVSGALAMAPSLENPYVSDIAQESQELSRAVLEGYCQTTGLKSLGIQTTDEMTGINWSTVPVTILEMGFMTNREDDAYLSDSSHYQAMARGIADGIDAYFEGGGTGEGQSLDLEGLKERLQTDDLDVPQAARERWSLEVLDLNTGASCQIDADVSMQSASVIKLFIMGAVYDSLIDPLEGAGEELGTLLTNMITVSDNEAANELVRRLGDGDFEAGAAAVNAYCQAQGFTATHLGRPFLAENPRDDNYTSAADCAAFLAAVYKGELTDAQASYRMLALLKQQTRKGKIPAGIPQEVQTANKTGEMSAGYGLGTIENDAAIVLKEDNPYVLCVLSNDIGDNAEAQSRITAISSQVYAYLEEAER